MKRIFIFLIVLFSFSTLSSFAQSERQDKLTLKWYTSLIEAQKLSNATKKPIFAFFTGSDWCGWCQKLQNDVFSKQAFIDWAKKNVILLELDYPRKKKLTHELQQQNDELQQVFKISGYPTVWIFFLTDDIVNNKKIIEPLGSLGYPEITEPGKEEISFLKTAGSIMNVKRK